MDGIKCKILQNISNFNKNFENNQPRYTFRLDLDRKWEDIYSGFHPTTRKILNKNNPFSLDVYKGSLDDLKDFYKISIFF